LPEKTNSEFQYKSGKCFTGGTGPEFLNENVRMPSGPVGARGRTQKYMRLSQRGESSTYYVSSALSFVDSVRPLAEKQTNLQCHKFQH